MDMENGMMKSSRSKWLVSGMLVLGVAVVAVSAVRGVEGEAGGDEAAIKACVDKYYRGVIGADAALIREAWDMDNGRMASINSGGTSDRVSVVPVSQAIAWWIRVKAHTSSSHVLNVDIVDGKMACVKHEFIYNKLRYIEFLTLFKINGTWKIVSKEYTQNKVDG